MFKRSLASLILVLALSTMAVPQSAVSVLLGTLTSVTTGNIYTWGDIARNMTFEIVTSGTPASCTINIDGSNVPSPTVTDMVDITGGITCTSARTLIHVVDKPVSSVRMNLTALSGGTSPSVKVYFTGIR